MLGLVLSMLGKALAGRKTYLAAVGLLGLAVYQFSAAEYEQAVQSLFAALAAFGLRQAVAAVVPVPPPDPEPVFIRVGEGGSPPSAP